jgi:hypothetical protein
MMFTNTWHVTPRTEYTPKSSEVYPASAWESSLLTLESNCRVPVEALMLTFQLTAIKLVLAKKKVGPESFRNDCF